MTSANSTYSTFFRQVARASLAWRLLATGFTGRKNEQLALAGRYVR